MKVRLLAPAKLTTSLRITAVRDDGYHEIEAEMVSLDLCDEVVVEAFDLGGHDPGEGAGLPGRAGGASGPPDLVEQALALAGVGARLRVHKAIPPGAGLGGGSSDAAAVLRWAGWRDVAGAARLGADVPFCLLGGRARVTGIGEVVDPLPYEECWYTLSLPPFGCSTPAVYAAWDRLGGPLGAHGNDLEAAALVVEPRLAAWRDRLGDATGVQPRLAGSGSTWFVPGVHPGDGRVVVRTVPSRFAGPTRTGVAVSSRGAAAPVRWPWPGSTAVFDSRRRPSSLGAARTTP